MKLAFLSGARSEYGLAKSLLRCIEEDSRFQLEIIVCGMHLVDKYGCTVNEILEDGFEISESVDTYSENCDAKSTEFSRTVEKMSSVLLLRMPDAVLIIGDRLEAYASALAAHFVGIPIIHSGGGHITSGAVDNIYRYNISNLASLHLTTSISAYERLRKCPVVDESLVHFVGSVAVDAIKKFRNDPVSISEYVPELQGVNYVLATLHPVTGLKEPINNILQSIVDVVSRRGDFVLITYPNNDEGAESIIEVIESNRGRDSVCVVESLGASGYYAALNDCRFVIGNSSSGLSEAPYFFKTSLNIGSRQTGRDKDIGVIDVPPRPEEVELAIETVYENREHPTNCNYLYGNGNSSGLAISLIAHHFRVHGT